LLPDVSLTAFHVAANRALETQRPDRLFADPFATGFLAAAPVTMWAAPGPDQGRRRGLSAWITVRTRFLDDLLLDACAGGIRQVVIFGAGLDARAFRLGWPEGVHLFELDMPGVLSFKEEVVRAARWRPACERVVIPVDLSEDWGRPLVAAGLDDSLPVVFVAEGLLAYLSREASDALVEQAAEMSPPGSRFGLTLASSRRLQAWREAHPDSTGGDDYVALWRSADAERAIDWLASFGWRARVFDVRERSAAYGRPLAAPSHSESSGAQAGPGDQVAGAVAGDSGARLVDAEHL